MMLDLDQVIALNARIDNRYTAEELCEILGLTTMDIIDKFQDELLELDWETLL